MAGTPSSRPTRRTTARPRRRPSRSLHDRDALSLIRHRPARARRPRLRVFTATRFSTLNTLEETARPLTKGTGRAALSIRGVKALSPMLELRSRGRFDKEKRLLAFVYE